MTEHATKRVLATGRLFGIDGPSRIKVAPADDVVRAAEPASPLATRPRFLRTVDAAFVTADRKLMAIVHESRSRRRG